MAGAEIIASGIGILCLIIFGYVLVGGILSVGENAASAQTDYVIMKESQRETAIDIPDSSPAPQFSCVDDSWTWFIWTWTWKKCSLTFNVTNTGTEMLGSFNQTDVFVTASENIIRGPGLWPWDIITPANTVTHLKFDPATVGSGGDEPSGTWSYIQISPDTIHPNMLDANEKMKVQINNYRFWTQSPVSYTIEVVSPNGITDTYTKI
jgi:hypothetical protein